VFSTGVAEADAMRGTSGGAALRLTGAQADTSTIWPTDFNAQRRRELGVIEVGDNNLA